MNMPAVANELANPFAGTTKAVSMGTTIASCVYDQGVILCADTRTSA
ncbi:hypothetical protein KIPB_014930, partial [Kipferlia bialata]|eukprot:g14930.t1